MKATLARLQPYLRHFGAVRWSFAVAIVAGVFYGAASGGLLPLASRNVFPLLFHSEEATYATGAVERPTGASLVLQDDDVYRIDEPVYKAPDFNDPSQEATGYGIRSQRFIQLETGASLDSDAVLWIHRDDQWIQLEPKIWFQDSEGIWRRRLGTRGLLWTVALLPLAFLLRGAAGFTNVYFINYAGLKVLEAIRLDLFAKFQTLPIAFFKSQSQGDLLSRLFNDTQQLRQSLLMVANDAVKQPFTLLFAVGFVIYESARTKELAFALLSLGVILVSVIPIRAIGKGILRKAKRMQQRTGLATAVAQENLRAYADVRAYGLAEREQKRFAREIQGIFRERMKIVKYNGFISPTVEFLSAIGVSAAILSASQSGLTLEKFAPIALALYMSYEPLKKLGAMNTHFKKGMAALERLEEAMETEGERDDARLANASPPADPQTLEFHGVSFSYGAEIPALQSIHLKIHRGESIALVGPSGAGKSTLAHLLPRFYDPASGHITVDDQDLRRFPLDAWRRRIAVVNQSPFIFRGSLRENIAVGRLDATPEELERAAQLAHVEEFASELPQGYDTVVGDDGATLSGGQRQRIALARAFLRDAPIVILDEATSALDARSEAVVSDAMRVLFKDRIGILIAHRMSSIRIADRIVVLNGGKVVGTGPHETLYLDCPLYRTLCDQQTQS